MEKQESDMTDAEQTAPVHALIERYMDLFNSADFETALRECYALPFSWLLGPAMDTVTSERAFVERMAGMRAALAADGLLRSDLTACSVRMMGTNAALIGVEVARRYGEGRADEMSAATYVAHCDGGKWRLVLLIAHPADAIVG